VAEGFDPYHRWLGIPPAEQPPNHYRLLGLSQFETDPEVIRDAVFQRIAHVRTYQLGPHSALSQKILNELGAAKACLLDPEAKAAYDKSLRAQSPAVEESQRPDPLAVLFAGIPESGPPLVLSPIRRRRRLPQRTLVAVGATIGLLMLLGLVVWGFRSTTVPEVASPQASGPVEGPSVMARQSVGESAKPPQPQATASTTASPSEAAKSTDSPPVPPPPLAVAPFSAAEAKEHQRRWAEYLQVPVETTNSIGMKFVLIPPGEFMMGSSEQEVAWASQEGKKRAPNDRVFFQNILREMPQHRVKITKPIYLAIYHVTQSEYERVMGVNPSAFTLRRVDLPSFKPPLSDAELYWRKNANVTKLAGQDTSRHPVDTVSWEQATEFCRRLSAEVAERDSSSVYRLPTEAEWEYACRAGTTTHWYCGDDEAGSGECGWTGYNSDGTTHSVGQKRSNAWGLHDMVGSLWQWCTDSFTEDYYKQSSLNDPTGPTNGMGRVLRGGCWAYIPLCCRSAYREVHPPEWRLSVDGFRVVRELPENAVQDAGKPENSRKISESPLTASPPSVDGQKQLAAAQAIFRLGGSVTLVGSDIKITKLEQLPPQPFQIVDVSVDGTVRDRDFDSLAGIRTLRSVRVCDPVAHDGKAGDGLMERLSASRAMQGLFLPHLLVTGSGLKKIVESFPELSHLEVCNELLSDEDLRQLQGLKKLKYLWINQTVKITDRGMHYVGELKQLEGVRMVALPLVTDTGFLELINLTALKSVAIDRRISEKAIAGLKKKWPDCHVEVAGLAASAGPAKGGDATAAASPKAEPSASPEAAGRPTPPAKPADPPAPAVAPFSPLAARKHQERCAAYLGLPVDITNSIGIKFKLIPAGTFTMGSTSGQLRRIKARQRTDEYLERIAGEAPSHPVGLTWPFYLGIFEVTQGEYERIVGSNPSRFKESGSNAPVEQVSWDEAARFCELLSKLPAEKTARRTYRLPTEAEWEYAARAGATTLYFFGDNEELLSAYAWWARNADKKTHPVGQRKANPFGLHDMYGNVWEWCADWFAPYSQSTQTDPVGPPSGAGRVLRGGSWAGWDAGNFRSAFRNVGSVGIHHVSYGFRIASDVPR
jgi:formylglycine-generating enzyme required for sulfatase activity